MTDHRPAGLGGGNSADAIAADIDMMQLPFVRRHGRANKPRQGGRSRVVKRNVEIGQRKRQAEAECLDNGLLACPAAKKCVAPGLALQRAQTGAFDGRKISLGQFA